MTRAGYITSVIRKLDHKLFCERIGDTFVIQRKKNVPRYFELEDGSTLAYLEEKPHNVIYLTHDWSLRGRPVDWGVDQVIMKLNSMDSHKRDVFKEIEENNRKIEESSQRETRNNIEARLYDAHSVFKKEFSEINTSSVKKLDRRRLKDKQVKN